ncbi:hypothetical protein EV191_107107 [Tamaricihabitans halophyticus]|uniref:Excreted virulence factor EspC (Type VII ESX diderm) n=1 Tax=Tamaricihabitans halophyticus TaxID=1262583 RepID=A0A4R2QMP5_9PSEU|nr:hypothetical protein [Tamaricihabitans halophyticus]TCP50843.1 hypothetical protein EV191_107107 [Tamaricihabitans halophyticus]
MANTGKDLGADLYALEQAAKSDLPTVADDYDSAIGKCNGAQQALDGIAAVPDQFVPDNGAVLDKYGATHEAILAVLRETRSALDETALALAEAVRLYAADDGAAASEFRRLLDDRGEPKPE